MGCDAFGVINLYLTARWNVNERVAPETPAETQEWKLEVERAITSNPGGDLLLAYGIQKPPLQERTLFRDKLTWIRALAEENQRKVWMLGERTHHPSRWQRVTTRERPTVPFNEAIGDLLAPVAWESFQP